MTVSHQDNSGFDSVVTALPRFSLLCHIFHDFADRNFPTVYLWSVLGLGGREVKIIRVRRLHLSLQLKIDVIINIFICTYIHQNLISIHRHIFAKFGSPFFFYLFSAITK